MSTPENPPAFPVPPGVTTFTGDPRDGAGYEPSQAGMTLRDYFAGQALIGELSCATSEGCVDALVRAAHKAGMGIEERIAWNCYRMADAMLAARTPTPQPQQRS